MSHAVAQLIEVATMRAGMTVNAKLKKKGHRTNAKVSAEAMIFANFAPHVLHGEWNDPIRLSWLCMPVGRWPRDLELARLPIPADHLMPDWWIPLNQPVSLSAPSPH